MRFRRDGLQLRAEHDRADLHRRLLQLGHDDRRLERSHQPGRVLADDDLDREASGRQRHARLIEDLFAGERLARARRQLQRFAEAADGEVALVAHHAEHVERDEILVVGDRHRRSRHGQRDRHVIVVGGEPEPAAGDEHRQIGGRHRGKHLLVELRLAVGPRRVGEVAVRVVAGARLDAQAVALRRGPGCGGSGRPCVAFVLL